ncbi:MAG: putative Tfp pilus assembly protein, major pilin PilA [Candidatus Gallionella acididurans]|jgi:type IV pilus assembly protein PilE|uniref:Putative Tfp pilus assembly protein, major pilin PilA n=1 Tax=Candidatus Gallionella acididurans TaxID=1796491 RepID=A0A139BSH3_9PROT|nr:MAG: putative Tfp pilus assembly protein, major pilin PilA [Candidatus Gallionella acididurans]
MKKQKGFTLIELMVTVAVVSILASIALPAYNSYVLRSKLAEAYANLGNFRVQMEQFYQDNRNYGSTACGVDSSGNVVVAIPAAPVVKYFTYTCSMGNGAQSYIATATGVTTDSTKGFAFTIDQSNNKATTVTSAVLPGWIGNTGCWVTKQGGAC